MLAGSSSGERPWGALGCSPSAPACSCIPARRGPVPLAALLCAKTARKEDFFLTSDCRFLVSFLARS